MQDKQVPCRIAGCENTWTWFAAQQIRGFGQPPPDRMCDEHLAQFNELADREVPCRTPGCPNTWTWKRGAQLAEMQRTGKLRRPSRLCAECFNAERETHDVQLPCKIDGCRRTWTWTRDAQLRHRLWVLRQRAKADAAAARASRSRDPQDEDRVAQGQRAGEAGEGASEARTSEGAASEGRSREGGASEGRSREGRSREGRNSEGRNSETRNSEGRNSETRNSEDRNSEGRSSEGGPSEGGPSEGGNSEGGNGEARSGESQAGEAPRERAEGREGGRRGRNRNAPREDGEAPRMRNREARDSSFDYAVTVERALPNLSAGSLAASQEAASEDMSAGTGTEGQVSETSDKGTVVIVETVEPGERDSDGVEADAETGGEAGQEPGEGGDRKKRRRKRRRGGKPVPNPEGPPERMCGLCAQKISRVQAKEQPCKVHGCSRTWTWDRASQMRAWVLSGSDDVDFEPPAPKRMCEVCREFCRTHPDREVPCGRPGCANTWTFKTGAQLQAFLAGRTVDPLKLCGECSKGEFAASFRPGGEAGAVPEGAETMPCVVPGCEGTWLYIPGMRLRDAVYGELSPDRMCDRHRAERGLAAAVPPEPQEVEVTAADLAVDEPEAGDLHEDGEHDHDVTDGEHEASEAGEHEPEASEAGEHEAGEAGEHEASEAGEHEAGEAGEAGEHPGVSSGVPVDPDPGA